MFLFGRAKVGPHHVEFVIDLQLINVCFIRPYSNSNIYRIISMYQFHRTNKFDDIIQSYQYLNHITHK